MYSDSASASVVLCHEVSPLTDWKKTVYRYLGFFFTNFFGEKILCQCVLHSFSVQKLFFFSNRNAVVDDETSRSLCDDITDSVYDHLLEALFWSAPYPRRDMEFDRLTYIEKLLQEEGANPDGLHHCVGPRLSLYPGQLCRNPLQLAVENHSLRLAHLLLRYHANPNAIVGYVFHRNREWAYTAFTSIFISHVDGSAELRDMSEYTRERLYMFKLFLRYKADLTWHSENGVCLPVLDFFTSSHCASEDFFHPDAFDPPSIVVSQSRPLGKSVRNRMLIYAMKRCANFARERLLVHRHCQMGRLCLLVYGQGTPYFFDKLDMVRSFGGEGCDFGEFSDWRVVREDIAERLVRKRHSLAAIARRVIIRQLLQIGEKNHMYSYRGFYLHARNLVYLVQKLPLPEIVKEFVMYTYWESEFPIGYLIRSDDKDLYVDSNTPHARA